MKKAVEQQQREVEKAVIGCGKYRLRTEYSFLVIAEEKWFRMTEAQHLQHLNKLNTCPLRTSGQACVVSTSSNGAKKTVSQSHNITV